MTEIDAILFDKDGTLFDYDRTWANWSSCFLLDLAGHNRCLARRLGSAVGFDLDRLVFEDDSPLVRDTPGDIATALLPFLPGASLTGIATRMAALSATVPQAEAAPLRPLLEDIASRGLILGVVTNDVVASTRAHLQDAGIETFFERIVACDSGFLPKPSPEMLLAFCDQSGIDPARAVMVGDSAHDMEAGRSAGMRRVGVLTGAACRRQLEPLADIVLPSVGALPDWLDLMAQRRTAA